MTQLARTLHVTSLPENIVLDYFWNVARNGGDRRALLTQLSTVIVPRDLAWDTEAIRYESHQVKRILSASGCFACLSRERRLYWHHVIWVTHGGSNTPRNFVPVCFDCHQSVHPWIEPSPMGERLGFSSLSVWAKYVLKKWLESLGANA